AVDVRVVERGVRLVQDREGTGVHLVERKHQGKGRKRTLAGREQGDVLQSLARRLDEDLDPGARTVIAIRVSQRRATSGIQLREVLVEVGRDRAEDGLVARLLLFAKLPDQVFEVGPRGGDVFELLREGAIALLPLAKLRVGACVRGAASLSPALAGAPLATA